MGIRKVSAIIDNDTKKLTKTSMSLNRKAKLCNDKEAESGADRYVQILKAPECWKFFLKVMYHLPYDTREAILEASTRECVNCPKRYFTYSAKKELDKLGY